MDYLKASFCSLLLVASFILSGCGAKKKENTQTEMEYKPGTFGYDLQWLSQHKEVVVLKSQDGKAQVAVCPSYQGRVMTSTSNGGSGYSFGWLNHELIASGKVLDHFNPIGGEERFWLGPEGGQFSIFFKPGTSFDFDNWYVPKQIDTEPFNTISTSSSEVVFAKDMELENYSKTIFKMGVKRAVRILDDKRAFKLLNVAIPESLNWVGFETENTLTNKGSNAWDKTSGMPSIWILSMLNPSPETAVIIPFKKGQEAELGKKVTDDYFGKVPADRLIVKEGVLFFKADGKKRSKIGISPKRALPIAGSYDATNGVLTIAQFTVSGNTTDYVNSLWEIQDEPFAGDAVNAYNDGPLEDGSQLGPFYEIESSSPAAALAPGGQLVHVHRTYHFKGAKSDLNKLSATLLGVELDEVLSAL